MTFGDISADYLQWYRDQLPVRPEFAQLGALAERIKPGAEGLRLRTDVARATAALDDVFDGMTSRHTCGHAVRCIMEAVARALGEQIAALSGDAAANEIRCAGGAARSDLWLQIKADMLDIATVPTNCPEPTSLGAAVLAEAALSGNDVRDVAQRWVSLKSSHRPDPKCHQQYLALRQERKSP
jgi:xylulokinase